MCSRNAFAASRAIFPAPRISMEVIFAAVSSNDMMYNDWAGVNKGLWDGDVEKR